MAMNDYGVLFNGARIVHPGAYDYIDASEMLVSSGGSLNLPIVIGEAAAGKPGTVHWFSNSSSAKDYLKNGDLPIALDLMFSPVSEGGGGASIVGVIISNETVQSSLTAGGITMKSLEYGEGGNKIQTKLENGTISGSKKFTAYRWDTNKLEIYDNLGAVIKIRYTGGQAYNGLTISTDGAIATALDIRVGATSGSSVEDVHIDLTQSQFYTLGSIVQYIDSLSNYTATLVNQNSKDMPVKYLQEMTDTSIATDTYLMAVAGDIQFQINKFSELVTVASVSNPTNYIYTYLTGGSYGSSPTSWASYLNVVKSQFSDLLVILSSNASIHAEAQAHVLQMESRNQKQVLFVGAALDETTDQIKNRVTALNSSRVVFAYPGIIPVGSSTVLPSYFTGALIAGRVAGVDPSEPITFDYVRVGGLEKDFLAGDPVINDLITSGVCTLERVQGGGIRIVQGITTYTSENNTLYREISVRRGADDLSEKMRKAMEDTFVGKKGLKATPSAIKTKAIEVLEQAVTNNSIAGYNKNSITVRFINTVVYVDYQVAPIEPINYVLVTSHFVPDQMSA